MPNESQDEPSRPSDPSSSPLPDAADADATPVAEVADVVPADPRPSDTMPRGVPAAGDEPDVAPAEVAEEPEAVDEPEPAEPEAVEPEVVEPEAVQEPEAVEEPEAEQPAAPEKVVTLPEPEQIVLPEPVVIPEPVAEPSLFTPYIQPDFEPAPYDLPSAGAITPPRLRPLPLTPPSLSPAVLTPAPPVVIPPVLVPTGFEPPAVEPDFEPITFGDDPLFGPPVVHDLADLADLTDLTGPAAPDEPVAVAPPPVPPAPVTVVPPFTPGPRTELTTPELALAGAPAVFASAGPRTPGGLPAAGSAAPGAAGTGATTAPDPRFRPTTDTRLPIDDGPGGPLGGPPSGGSWGGDPEQAPRGRHANGAEHRWGWVAAWTLLGTLLPGSGLIAAGYRRLGAALLVLALAVPVIGAVWFWRSGLVGAVTLGTDGRFLLTAAVVLVVGAVVAVGLMLLTNAVLMRRADVGGAARLANVLLVTALIAVIGAPAAVGTRYLLITRTTLPTVFGDDDSASDTGPDSGQDDPWAGMPRVNVLLIGSDADDDREGTRTDSMILASIDTRTGDTVLLSPPRNLQRVPFPKGTKEREVWPYGFGNTRGGPWPRSAAACGAECDLSAVWRWAEDNREQYYPNEKQPGAVAIRHAIEGAFGMKIDSDVVVDIDGFKAVVDALGGITVNIKQDLPIGGSSEYPVAKAWLRKGDNQKLNGYRALWYARSRWSTTDYDRMNRQRCVIAALNEQVDPVSLVRAYPGLAKAAGDNISTDIASSDLSAWVELALKIKKAQVRSLTITSDVISYAHPDYAEIRSLVDKALVPPAAKPASTPSAVATPAPSATRPAGNASPGATPTPDPTEAQDVRDVC